MPPSGRSSRRLPRSVPLWAVATSLVTALVVAGCAGSVTADEARLLASSTSTPEAAPELGSTLPPAAKASIAPDAGLLTTTPDSTSHVGTLAPDFPTDLLPLPGDAVILVTAAVPVGSAGVREVSLNLQTSWPAAKILDLYRTTLVAAGFTEVPAVDTSLATESTFTRSDGDEVVSIGVFDDSLVRTVTVGGRIHSVE